MDRRKAKSWRDQINEKLRSLDMQSYAKIVPLQATGDFEVRVVLHPDEDHLQSKLPSSVGQVPWESKSGEQYVTQTPRTPLQKRQDDWSLFYPSPAKRRHDGPRYSPDKNPAYPGMRRIPEIQDLVRSVAMKKELVERIARVEKVLSRIHRLERLARRAGHGFVKESEHLVSELMDQLKEDGYTGRHKIVRLTKKLQNSMKSDGYSF